MTRNKKTSDSLFHFMNRHINLLTRNGQYSTMLHYKTARNCFKRYRNGVDISLKDIDTDEIKSYEAYLKNVEKVCCNTSSFYLRILRATYNKAVAKGLTPQRHPFKGTYTGIAKTRKRAVPIEIVSRIKCLESATDLTINEEMARDAFLACFFLRGISFIDLAHLRKSDLKDGYLHYIRSKTRQCLSIRWEKEMQDIVDRYQDQTAFSPYLFPFLADGRSCVCHTSKGKKQEEQRLYHNVQARISYNLKKLGEKIGVKGKLTLYVARHSWATAARDSDVSISVISEALGHHSVTTTQIYLRSIKCTEVDDANAKILAAIDYHTMFDKCPG